MPRICGVYLITNTTNGKLYVGSSVHVQNRWGQHRHDLRRGRHDNGYLQRAWNKYGEAAFEFSLVTQSAPEALLDWEQAWLDVTQCYERNKGYNLIQYAARRGVTQ